MQVCIIDYNKSLTGFQLTPKLAKLVFFIIITILLFMTNKINERMNANVYVAFSVRTYYSKSDILSVASARRAGMSG